MALNCERPSARMSKNTNDGLIWSDTACFMLHPYGNSGHQMVNIPLDSKVILGQYVYRYDDPTSSVKALKEGG